MQRKSFEDMVCPIARSLDKVGEWWSILILRDVFFGRSRFDELQKSLGIAPNILTTRLRRLVSEGLLEKRAYQDRPVRHEYVLTEQGRDLQPVLLALAEFGNRHLADRGRTMKAFDNETGLPADPVYVDRVSGREITTQNFSLRSAKTA
ncbi:helix-turn-helix domain-containing protein [Sinorhizobium sp. BG8]|uniref:winged helix-turn-helix transcriptional regulator n=1 Tax=Sinorhizobium sp. BG8 TaxID=2613773 RepID=UPI00193DE817|nr:helix-turn-helix domain-containing protein [Sinorhizobium sp. BG8]QRM53873.1 helix-turn-helix transcriptional regulator [Sinorhizobium sp. BG8]